MIVLDGMTKRFIAGSEVRTVFEDVTLELPTDGRFGILGGPRSGKSVLIRLLAGLEDPTAGHLARYSALSVPVGYAGGFRPNMSGRETIQFAARLYGADPYEVLNLVTLVTELGDMIDEPLRRFPHADRTALAYAISYALPFDTYLFDEFIAVGTPAFRARCMEMFHSRAAEAGFILATSHPRKIHEFCTSVGVLSGKNILLFDKVQDGVDFFETQGVQGAA
jgi:capsular polysaccharide transport system ATP-binding protein